MAKKKRRRYAQVKSIVPVKPQSAADGFVNSLAYLGEASELNRANDFERHSISNDYEKLTVMYRENWLAARIIDTPCEDMTRAWYTVASEIDQEKLDDLAKLEAKHSVQQEITNAIRWARLYGGAAAVMVIKGQEDMLSEPLDFDMIQPGCFRGLIVVDKTRGIFPSLELEDDMDDPEFGYPKWYDVMLDEESGATLRIHHSRLLLFRGRMLPIDEEIREDYWGASELEHVYEELQKRNATSANIAQLVFQANVAALKMSDFGEVMGMGTPAQREQVYRTIYEMNRLRTSFGVTLMSQEDSYEQHPYSFAGVAEVYETFMMDMAGAAEIPATKLFGRAPQGMNSTGESDMKNYYEVIAQLQERQLKPALEKLLPVMCMSLWGVVPDDLEIVFEPLGTTTPSERATIMGQLAAPIVQAYSAGLVTQKMALMELRETGKPINAWTNISDDDIEKASDEFDTGEMGGEMGGMPGMPPEMGGQPPVEPGAEAQPPVEQEMEAQPMVEMPQEVAQPEVESQGEVQPEVEQDSDRVQAMIERLNNTQVGRENPERTQAVLEKLRKLQARLESDSETQGELERLKAVRARLEKLREQEAEDGGPGSGPPPGYKKKSLIGRIFGGKNAQATNPATTAPAPKAPAKKAAQTVKTPAKAPAKQATPQNPAGAPQVNAQVAPKAPVKQQTVKKPKPVNPPHRPEKARTQVPLKKIDPRNMTLAQKAKAFMGGLAGGLTSMGAQFGQKAVRGGPPLSGGGGTQNAQTQGEVTSGAENIGQAPQMKSKPAAQAPQTPEAAQGAKNNNIARIAGLYTGTKGQNMGAGNIDLNHRPVVKNPDGTISTERSFSTNIDGKEVLLPTVVNGKIVNEQQAIQHYLKTGENLGKFDTPEEADKYAKALHERQDWYYNQGGNSGAKKPAGIAERARFMMNPTEGLREHQRTANGPTGSKEEVERNNKERKEWADLTTHQKLAGTAAENRHIRKMKQEVMKAAAKGDIQKAKQIVAQNRHYWQNDPNSAMKVQSETLRRQKAAPKGLFDEFEEDGGPGSGNFFHAGRPGQRGGSAPSGTGSSEPVESKQPVDNGTQEAYNGRATKGWKSLNAAMRVGGPKATRKFVRDYIAEHPEIRKEIPKYMGVRRKVLNFTKDFPEAENFNTYDAETGKVKNINNGFCVTFHQNNTAEDPLGAYSDAEYAAMCAIAMKELGASGVNIGYYGNPEVSFECKDEAAAKKFAVEHNQQSIYNASTGRTLKNKKYDSNLNPIRL